VLLFHLKGFEVKRVKKDLKLKTVIKAKGFEVQSGYLKVARSDIPVSSFTLLTSSMTCSPAVAEKYRQKSYMSTH
jgi:hypothetical protein